MPFIVDLLINKDLLSSYLLFSALSLLSILSSYNLPFDTCSKSLSDLN